MSIFIVNHNKYMYVFSYGQDFNNVEEIISGDKYMDCLGLLNFFNMSPPNPFYKFVYLYTMQCFLEIQPNHTVRVACAYRIL